MLKIDILGRPLTLKCTCEPEVLQEVVRLVEEKIKEIRKELPRIATEDLLIMVALNLAFDYLEIKEDSQHFRREVTRRSEQLLRMIEHQSSLPLR